jgi:hypothetical protein
MLTLERSRSYERNKACEHQSLYTLADHFECLARVSKSVSPIDKQYSEGVQAIHNVLNHPMKIQTL